VRAKDKDATKVADKIASKVKAGTTTVLIRRWVITELKPLDAKAAEAYMKYWVSLRIHIFLVKISVLTPKIDPFNFLNRSIGNLKPVLKATVE
jgi:hypothetical protein